MKKYIDTFEMLTTLKNATVLEVEKQKEYEGYFQNDYIVIKTANIVYTIYEDEAGCCEVSQGFEVKNYSHKEYDEIKKKWDARIHHLRLYREKHDNDDHWNIPGSRTNDIYRCVACYKQGFLYTTINLDTVCKDFLK